MFSSNAKSANVNPILAAARENWDNDPWGQALSWLDALADTGRYRTGREAAEAGGSHELEALVELQRVDGEWSLPVATDAHVAHAVRVFDRMADVARANGLDY